MVSKLLQICCYELAANENIQNELRKIFNESKNFIDSKLLHYFILECLRKWPLIGNINRVCNKDCTIQTINGECLKFFSGDLVKVPIKLINNDHKIFLDPLGFDVNRIEQRNEPYISFGLGFRSCICADFSLIVIKSAIFEFLQKYKITLADGILRCNSQFETKNFDQTTIFEELIPKDLSSSVN